MCKNSWEEKSEAFNVEKLGEGELQRRIRDWENGPKMVIREEGNRTSLFVTMLAMGPTNQHINNPLFIKEQAKQDIGKGQVRGFEAEVQKNNHLQINLF